MWFPTLYTMLIVGGLVPIYVVFYIYFMVKKPPCMNFFQHIFVFTIGLAIYCAICIHLGAASALAGVVPTLLEFPVHIKPVKIENAVIPEEFHHFNPCIMRVDHGKHYLISVREGNFNNCPVKHGYPKINVFSFNRVIIGAGPSREGPFKQTLVLEKPYNKDRGRLQGYEDGRFIPMGHLDENGDAIDEIGILVVEKHQLYLFRYSLSFAANGRCSMSKIGKEVHVRLLGARPSDKQKNWMFIPSLKTEGVHDKPRFVQWINPLTVVELNTSGIAREVYKAPFLSCITPRVHGSTNFLREPNNPRKLIGFVHLRYDTFSFVPIPYYNSAVLEIEESEDGNEYHITRISKDFRFPSSDNANKTHRIHFPMSMMYTDKSKQTVSISMGYMDCTSHIVTVKTADLLKVLHDFVC